MDLKPATIRNPLTVSPQTPVLEAIAQMSDCYQVSDAADNQLDDPFGAVRSSCVVVVDNERVVGILTERDVVRLNVQQQPLNTLVMQQVMLSPVITLQESAFTDVNTAIHLLQRHHVRHLAILDNQDHLVGLITDESLQQSINAYQLQTEQHIRQQVEVRLQETEQRHASLIAAAPVAIFRADAAGHCIYVNEQCCQITGYAPAALIGKAWQPWIHPEDRDRLIAQWRQFAPTGDPFQVECRYQRSDGDYRWGYAQVVPEHDSEGQVIGYVGTLTDISDHQQTETVLHNIVEGTTVITGQDFFPALASYLASALSVSAVLVTEVVDEELRSLAFWANGGLQPAYQSHPARTPCGRSLQAGQFYCAGSVQQMFPEDSGLVEMEAESYLGIALQDSQGRAIGNLGIFHQQPIHLPDQAKQILRVFGARAAAELERQRALTSFEHLNQELETKVVERTAKLQHKEAQIRAIVEAIPDLLLHVGRDGTCLNYLHSPNSVGEFLPIQQELAEVLPPALLQQQLYRIDRAITTGTLQVYEHQFEKQGRLVHEEIHIVAINSAEALIIVRDITYRKQAEQALQDSQQFAQAVLDTIPLPVFWKDRNSVFLGSNQPLLEAIGLSSAAELIGKTDFDFAATQANAIHYRADDQATMTSGEAQLGIEETLMASEGEQRWLETHKAPLRDWAGNVVGVVGTFQDVTERRQAEDKVRTLLNRAQLLNQISSEIRDSLHLDRILQTSVNAIVTKLPADICTFAWYQETNGTNLWEVVKEQKKPELPTWLGTHQLNELPTLLEHLLQNHLCQVDSLAKLESLSLKTFLENAGIAAYLCLPIHTTDGKIGSLQIGRIENEHPWKKGEIQLLQDICNQIAIAIYQANLYEESQAKTKELQRSYHDLKETQLQLIQSEKMSSLGQLVAGIAHEVNNPMSFIYGNLQPASEYAQDLGKLIQIYQETYPTPPPKISAFIKQADIKYILSDFPKLLSSMKTGVNRIQDIIQSLQTFSRSGRIGIQSANLHENIDSTLMVLQNRLNGRAGRPEIEVIKDYGDLPLVECYVDSLNQVFMNLLVNAIDAIEEQQVDAEPDYVGCITITTRLASDNKITISIRDNGSGMSPDTQAKIFNPFFTTKPVGVGTGMGLSVSYQIVTSNHQGQLHCYSEVGVGTQFVIEL
ncbi:MAG: PAS domain S-box protein [Leptolyngbyaceae cyanobacterium]